MVARNVSKRQSALVKARERRRATDKARDEQDRRIEEATATVLIALEIRAEAEQALEAATGQVGVALRHLIAEDVSADRAAALLELDVVEVRRLARVARAGCRSAMAQSRPDTKTTVPQADAGEGDARRTG